LKKPKVNINASGIIGNNDLFGKYNQSHRGKFEHLVLTMNDMQYSYMEFEKQISEKIEKLLGKKGDHPYDEILKRFQGVEDSQ
jgi:hypothetical protein